MQRTPGLLAWTVERMVVHPLEGELGRQRQWCGRLKRGLIWERANVRILVMAKQTRPPGLRLGGD